MSQDKLLIYLNVSSGFGYGIIILLSILIFFSEISISLNTKYIIVIFSLFFISSSLLSYIFNPDHNKGAWRTLSQWKSSWLSRHSIFAILSFIFIIIFFLFWIFAKNQILINLSIFFSGLLSLATIICLVMKFSSVKSVYTWNNSLVPILYILNSLISGGLFLFCIFFISENYNYFLSSFIKNLIPITLFLQLIYWFSVKNHNTKHSTKIINQNNLELLIVKRFVAIILLYVLPLYTLWNTPNLYINKEVSEIIYILTMLFFIAGILVERKLFFDKEKNIVNLNYENK